jgi:hypothetical protein
MTNEILLSVPSPFVSSQKSNWRPHSYYCLLYTKSATIHCSADLYGETEWHWPYPLFNVKSEPKFASPSSEFDELYISPVLISETFQKRAIPRTPILFLLTSTFLTLPKKVMGNLDLLWTCLLNLDLADFGASPLLNFFGTRVYYSSGYFWPSSSIFLSCVFQFLEQQSNKLSFQKLIAANTLTKQTHVWLYFKFKSV